MNRASAFPSARSSSLPLVVAALVLMPFVNPSKPLSIQILIWGTLAISYNLLLGYTGLLSFGHAIFFGVGAYATGIFLKSGHGGLWSGIGVGMVAAAVTAVSVGWFCLRRRGVYFGMLTLAFGQMFFFAAYQADRFTGGDDGLQGVPTPGLAIPGLQDPISLVSLRYPYRFYFVCLVVVIAILLANELVVRSPFGRALQAIRESEERSLAVGYNTNAVQWLAFVMSGAIAGVAGALNTMNLGFASIDSLSLETSGMVLIMTILGGKGYLLGPFVGAAMVLVLQDVLSAYTDSWQLALGAIFVLVVLLAPTGMTGALAHIASSWARRREPHEVPLGRGTRLAKP